MNSMSIFIAVIVALFMIVGSLWLFVELHELYLKGARKLKRRKNT